MKTPTIFLHIPKTAGTTLRSVLAPRYTAQSVYTIGNDINRDIQALCSLPTEQRDKIKLLQGHMSFGLHHYLAPGARYITVMRDPVERVLSEYRFLTTNKRHPFYHRVVGMSLSDFLDSEFNAQSRNGQVRLMSGSHRQDSPGIPDDGEIKPAHLERALENLNEHFLVAGTQDQFELTLLLCWQKLGWFFYPFYIARNITVQPRSDPDSADIETIRQQNLLDIKLYKAVQSKMNQNIEQLQPGLDRSLERFKRLNPYYRFLYMRWVNLRQKFAAGRR